MGFGRQFAIPKRRIVLFFFMPLIGMHLSDGVSHEFLLSITVNLLQYILEPGNAIIIISQRIIHKLCIGHDIQDCPIFLQYSDDCVHSHHITLVPHCL
jgi:uncharacterized membrane protein YqaE (UPF0057 family)